MTVSTTTNRASYSGNGSTTAFAYGFKIFADADLTVIIRASTGAETTKTLSTHYNVSGAGNASGGNVTFTSGNVPASGETVVILRELTLTQGTDYVANDPFPAESHEDALDRLTMITQQLDEAVGRSLKVSSTNVIATSEFTTSATDRANKLLSFDGDGDLTVTEGKVDTVTSSVSAVSAGGTPTASATYTVASGALALAFGLVTGNTGATGLTGSTGAAGANAGIGMTFSNSTSDADPGAGKLAFNNGTVSSASVVFIDDADDNGVDISGFVQSFDDVSNAVARGILLITKEGAASTFALFKVTGAVTDASGYNKVAVTHVASNGTFSNADGIRVHFTYSGADAASTDLSVDSSPQLGGNLDVVTHNIVSTSNRNINILPNGTGNVSLGNLVFNADQSAGSSQDNFVLTFDNSASTISLEAVQPATPNLIINGNMAVSQRGASSTGVSAGGYETVDRFRTAYNGTPDQLRVTHAQVADAPAGFTNSFKLTVTTEEDALASDERVRFQQRIEAFNLQQLAFGTSSASAITLSFYVKSSIAGTYGVDLKNSDASRSAAQSYTISSADTWEKKTLTFAGDTAGAFNNDNGEGLVVSWVLAAGTDYTSGTLATAFASTTNANLAPSGQENLIGTDNATWQLTGVQLQAGTIANPVFQHELYAETLQKCQRYYNRLGFMKHQFYSSSAGTTNPDLVDSITFPPMRDAPAANPYTDANYSSSGSTNTTDTTLTLADIGISSLTSAAQRSSSGAKTVRTTYYLELVSEL